MGGKAALRERDDLLTDLEGVDARAKRYDAPGAFLAQARPVLAGTRSIVGERAQRREHVEEVQPDGLDLDLDLARLRQTATGRPQGQLLKHAGMGDLETKRLLARRRQST